MPKGGSNSGMVPSVSDLGRHQRGDFASQILPIVVVAGQDSDVHVPREFLDGPDISVRPIQGPQL
jgi:hypothetical protein